MAKRKVKSASSRKRAKRSRARTHGDFVFDEQRAQHALDFIEALCTHVKGEWAGEPLTLAPWEREAVREMFGWVHKRTRMRRYRFVYLSVGRKNGKSTLGAAIALYLLFGDKEPGAEVYSAAADRDQAAIVFDVAHQMVENEPELGKRSTSYRRSIVYHALAAKYQVLSSDVPTKHGLNPHGVIFDELHAQPNRDLYDVLTTGRGGRRQPLVVMLTTAGYDRQSICYEVYQYARKVRDGVIDDPSFLPLIYEADADDDWQHEDVWKKANPNLGLSPKLDFLRDECARAIESPGFQNTFRRLYLNQWTEQATRWLDMDVWLRNAKRVRSFKGRAVYAALDLASTTDLVALALCALDGDEFDVDVRFYCPSERVAIRSRRDRVPYDVWVRQGFITMTDGDVVDQGFIRRDLNALHEQDIIIKELAIDPWNAAKLTTELQGDGFNVVQMRQGFASMSAPSKEFEALLRRGALRHGNNPVLSWMASNVAVKQDPAGNIKPDKAKSTERIDGIVAAIMALARCVAHAEPQESIYSSGGLFVIGD